MAHIEVTRLINMSQEAVISDAEDNAHLRLCTECNELLRTFIRQYKSVRELLEKSTVRP
jgi:hypothetical protein